MSDVLSARLAVLPRRPVSAFVGRWSGAPWLSGLVLLVLILGVACAPLLTRWDPLEIDLAKAFAPPFYAAGGSWDHPLGTDNLGRDILSRILYGGRVTLLLSVLAIVLGIVAGTLLGLLSGYRGGWVDVVIQRSVEAILSLPTMMVALVFIFVLGQSFTGVVLVLSPFIAARFARMVRGDVLSVRALPYVDLARVAGASDTRIILRHVLPNVAGTIIVVATLEVGQLILVVSSLSFLGLGVPPPSPEWGLMVSAGRQYVATNYWLSLFPGLAIVLTVLAINVIGDWLRDVLDPKRVV
ncbi:MAG TPA: ABC transporter permease [Actinophytocola sp.]|jgi:peptide/nickel transport system permease protein|nr:ABC transporter permease [Actinophytocola sp.]